jgi:hypothetical protein
MLRRSLVLAVAAAATIVLAIALIGAVRGASDVNPKLVQVTNQGVVSDGDLVQVIASCPDGYGVTGGGYVIESINPANFVHFNAPLTPEVNDGLWGWAVTMLNESGVQVTLDVQALCLKS